MNFMKINRGAKRFFFTSMSLINFNLVKFIIQTREIVNRLERYRTFLSTIFGSQLPVLKITYRFSIIFITFLTIYSELGR